MVMSPEAMAKFGQVDDISLVISEKGNALKADADDPTNTRIRLMHMGNKNIAGDMGTQTTTNDPISNIIGLFTGLIKGIFDAIGGFL